MKGHHPAAHPHESPHHPHWPLASLLFLFVFLLGLFSVHESATWLHIKTGAKIVAEGAIPSADPFSYSVQGKAWTTDSWLSDALFFLLHRRYGPQGVIAAKALAAAAAFALLLPLNPASPVVAASMLALAAVSAWTGLTEMPGVFDLLMLSLFIRRLRSRRRLGWSGLAGTAALECLWVNLTGPRAVIGLCLVGIKAFKISLKADARDRVFSGLLAGAAAAAFLVNPHGWAVLTRLFGPLSANATAWEPASVLGPYGVFAAAGLAACWVCLQQEFFLSFTAAGLVGLSLLFPGLRPLCLLGVCPAITLALGHFIHPVSDTFSRVARLALALAALFFLHWRYLYCPLAHSRGYWAQSLDGAVHYLQASGIAGKMFNDVESGAGLLAGDRPVFVDGRAALYGSSFMKDAASWPARWRSLDEIYGFDYAVIANRRGAYPARALDAEPWRLAYADDSALVYVKKSGMNAWLVSGKPRAALEPNRLWPDGLDAPLSDPKKVPRTLDELDRWILQAPDSIEALLWKAYALDRLKLAEKAERLLFLAQARPRLAWDSELIALEAFVLENRGQAQAASKAYGRAAGLARRLGDRGLESAVLGRLVLLARQAGQEWEAKGYEERIRDLAAAVPAEES